MIDLTNPKHVHVEFKHVPVKNEGKSKEAGRPIFEDREMVIIKFVSDKKKEIAALAHEKFMHEPGSSEWVTYAQAFPRHYEAFKAGQSGLMLGTPLSECGFLTPAQVMEYAAVNLHTVEQLAALEGANLQRLGMNGRSYKSQAIQYLDERKDKALEYRLKLENDELRKRLDALEAIHGRSGPAQSGSAPQPEDGFEAWSDVDLKAFIKQQTGQAPRGTPGHETLVEMAREAEKEAA